MKKIKDKKILKNIVIFLLLFIIFFIIQKIFNISNDKYYFDVAQYNSIGESLFSKGHFSINTIATGFRGFVFPSFMGLCNFIDLKLGITNSIHILSSIIFAILFVIYLNFCEKLFLKKEKEKNIYKYLRYLFPVILTIIFFYGLVIYPLTDLYAALLCLVSGATLYSAIDSRVRKYIKYFLTGILIYLTYNIRTIYQLTIFLYIIIIFIYEFKNKKLKNVFFPILFYILGVLVGSIPQFMINYNLQRMISPWINNGNLFAQQLFWGLEYPKYATAIGKNIGGLYFVDNVGVKIATEWTNSGLPITILNYCRYFLKYPLEYCGIIGRHIYNCFFILYPEQYIENLNKNTVFYAIFSIIIIFIFGYLLYVYFKKNKIDWKKCIFILVLLFPSIAILFGAVEERFMILPYLLIYGFITFFDFSYLKKFLNKKRIIVLIVIFAIFTITSLSIESGILGELKNYPLLFNN